MKHWLHSHPLSVLFICMCVCVCACVLKLCPTLCDLMNYSLPGSSIHGISRQEWVAISSSRDLPDPGVEPVSLASSALAGRFFTTAPPGKPHLFV